MADGWSRGDHHFLTTHMERREQALCGMRLFQETRPATFHYIITDAFQGITSVLVSTTPRARTGSGTRFRDYGPPYEP